MTIHSEPIAFDKHRYHEQVSRLWTPVLARLNRLMTSYVLFNVIFLGIGAMEIVLFLAFFSWLGQSTILAFTLALFFLTIFSYAVIRLYFQTKKPEELMTLCEEYLKQCKEIIRYQEGVPEHHIAIANALSKFSANLHEKEYSYYPPSERFKSFAPLLEKLSAFCHWKDLHRLREFLLTRSVAEHIKVVKCEPTNLEVHAALANAYVTLSALYADPRKYEGYDEERWIPLERLSSKMHEKFRAAAGRAIEEFKILNDYAPDDPWVHIQLAYSYHDLQMPQEEIQEYETILHLRPGDQDTLFKLGMLYFQLGRNAQGLRVYEQLKSTHYKKAESLIKFYGAYDSLI